MSIIQTIWATIASTENNVKYYYSQLTDEQQKIYEAIISGLVSYSKKIKIPLRPINETSKIFSYVLLDNPLIFYVTSFSCQNDLYKKKSIFIPDYTYEQAWVKEKTAAIIDNLRVFDSMSSKSDYNKELFVHDYCLNNFTYDDSPDDLSHTVLGPVMKNAAVCEGISKYVKLALDYLSVNTVIITGKMRNPYDPSDDSINEDHSWNIVKIDNDYYHLDVTADITVKNVLNRYDYFNLSDYDIKKDHFITGDSLACTTEGNDYYTKHKMSARKPAEVKELIGHHLRKGKKSIVFKIEDAKFSDKLFAKLKDIAEQQYSSIRKGKHKIDIIYNASQMVFEMHFQ